MHTRREERERERNRREVKKTHKTILSITNIVIWNATHAQEAAKWEDKYRKKQKRQTDIHTHTHNLSTARKKALDIYTYALNIYNNAGTIQNYKARNKIHTNGKCRLS